MAAPGGNTQATKAGTQKTQPSSLSQPPPALADAIRSAAAKYDVPADLLAGIWRVESGSSYPNPYGNIQGYGGLFGTSNWSEPGATLTPVVDSSGRTIYKTDIPTPVSEQANESAKVLASALIAAGGNVAKALSSYSGGGYTQVPGEVIYGKWTVGASSGSDAAGIGGDGKGGIGGTAGSGAGYPGENIIKGAEGLPGDALSLLSNPLKKVVYALAIGGGGVMMLVGMVMIGIDLRPGSNSTNTVVILDSARRTYNSARPSTRAAARNERVNRPRQDKKSFTVSRKPINDVSRPLKKQKPQPANDIPF